MANDREQFNADAFLDSFDKEFDSEQKTPSPAVPEVQESKPTVEAKPVEKTEEIVEETQQEEVAEELEEEIEEPKEEAKPTEDVKQDVNDPDVHKRNEAF